MSPLWFFAALLFWWAAWHLIGAATERVLVIAARLHRWAAQ